MFTERFIQVPAKMYNCREADVTGKRLYDCESIKVRVRIDPGAIESYYPCVPSDQDFEQGNVNAVSVCMRNGDSYIALVHIVDFEKLLNGVKE